MKNLVIVESATKSKTIAKYLNANKNLKHLGEFTVVASFGHVRDLKKKELGIAIEDNFKPVYDVLEDKQKVIRELKEKAKECDMVWLASDADFEGEAIAMHLREVLKLKKYKRITFTEITPSALENAVLHPRLIDEKMVDAQETRRMLDRLVGFKLSPLLWKVYKTESWNGLSAGRVQSAVMHLILEKEKEIDQHTSSSYWHYLGDFILKMKGEKHELKDVNLYYKTTVAKEDKVNNVVKFLKAVEDKYSIQSIRNKEVKKNADLPYITSTLQQDAYSKMGFSLKRTMQLAQELYEKGYITYMRTDSHNISDDFRDKAQAYIVNTFGDDYYGGGSSKKKVVKGAQQAHEAIRPTKPNTTAEDVTLSVECKRLYDMIWKRTIGYFMKPCIMDELEINFVDSSFDKDTYFVAVFSKVKFNGFMILYDVKNEVYDFKKYMDAIQEGQYTLQGEKITAKNTWTSPPQRYNDSSIIRTLEKEGIGRPSTYATIMNKLYEKNYVIKTDIAGVEKQAVHLVLEKGKIREDKKVVTVGQEKSKVVSTDIGKEVDRFLSANFEYIIDKTFTSNMEADLDRIADGDKEKQHVLQSFWKHFSKDLSKFSDHKEKKIVLKTESKEMKVDGVAHTVRIAKYGPVIEYTENDAKKFISLKVYLKLIKKEMMDITDQDIRLLKQLPKTVGKVNGIPAYMHIGPYGFYIKYDTKNVSLPKRVVQEFLTEGVVSQKDIESAIEYYDKSKAQKANEPNVGVKKAVKKK